MEPVEVLSKDQIRRYLASLIAKGTAGSPREGPTVNAIGNYMGIPKNDMIWLSRKDTARMSLERQRLFSKVIAMIENGHLVFERRGNRKVAVLVDRPKPIMRYAVQFGGRGPVLRTVERPRSPALMPTFKQVLLR